ncbi:MAG: hypothetical protein K0S76_447 [Herbinix sp.]|jgi:hypothetical protein|nr:hypothetical protein [Herbinix sp.]
MENKIYLCDPSKNIQCKKTRCKYNKDVKYPVCDKTKNINCSTNGKPIDKAW